MLFGTERASDHSTKQFLQFFVGDVGDPAKPGKLQNVGQLKTKVEDAKLRVQQLSTGVPVVLDTFPPSHDVVTCPFVIIITFSSSGSVGLGNCSSLDQFWHR